jgi:hypothetical protein
MNIQKLKQDVKEICERYNIPHNLDYERKEVEEYDN